MIVSPSRKAKQPTAADQHYRGHGASIGKSAQRLLARLTASDIAAPAVETSTRAHDAADVDVLLCADLISRGTDGHLAVTDAGRAYLARLAARQARASVDPFLAQHIGLAFAEVTTADGRVAMAIDSAESPLAWLARRKGRDGSALIDPIQLQAGERLRADVTIAQMLPRVTANWSAAVASGRRADGGGAMHVTEAAVAARQRVDHALGAVGPEFAGLLLDVCCFLKGLEDVERERRWPSRSAKVVLQLGLDRLARHYGYASEARGKSRARIRTWNESEPATSGAPTA